MCARAGPYPSDFVPDLTAGVQRFLTTSWQHDTLIWRECWQEEVNRVWIVDFYYGRPELAWKLTSNLIVEYLTDTAWRWQADPDRIITRGTTSFPSLMAKAHFRERLLAMPQLATMELLLS